MYGICVSYMCVVYVVCGICELCVCGVCEVVVCVVCVVYVQGVRI